jgi:hypothetical protein
MQITNSDDHQLMVMAAHRYCLGRQTYVVSACTRWLESQWPLLTESTRRSIVTETEAAISAGTAGNECDVADWTLLLERVAPKDVLRQR